MMMPAMRTTHSRTGAAAAMLRRIAPSCALRSAASTAGPAVAARNGAASANAVHAARRIPQRAVSRPPAAPALSTLSSAAPAVEICPVEAYAALPLTDPMVIRDLVTVAGLISGAALSLYQVDEWSWFSRDISRKVRSAFLAV